MELNPDCLKIKLDETCCYLTVFHANDKLLRSQRLIMGSKPSREKLNFTLKKKKISHINNEHLIHDNIIIATEEYVW